MTVLVLAPHPDDFDAIGVTLRQLHERQHQLHLAVLTGGANGVDGNGSSDEKTAVREAEQRDSCRFFGLPGSRCHFLRLWEDPLAEADDEARLRAHILGLRPDLVFMPHGNDSNATHRRTCQNFCAIAAGEQLTLQACLNQDAKTRGMRSDLYTGFDAEPGGLEGTVAAPPPHAAAAQPADAWHRLRSTCAAVEPGCGCGTGRERTPCGSLRTDALRRRRAAGARRLIQLGVRSQR